MACEISIAGMHLNFKEKRRNEDRKKYALKLNVMVYWEHANYQTYEYVENDNICAHAIDTSPFD